MRQQFLKPFSTVNSESTPFRSYCLQKEALFIYFVTALGIIDNNRFPKGIFNDFGHY